MIGKSITLNGTTKGSKSQDKSVTEISPALIDTDGLIMRIIQIAQIKKEVLG